MQFRHVPAHFMNTNKRSLVTQGLLGCLAHLCEWLETPGKRLLQQRM